MKFTANRKHFAEALKTAAACTSRHAVIPVLSNALLQAENGTVSITCTNLEQRITVSFAAEVERDGKTTLPASKLVNLLGRLTGDRVEIDTNDDHISEITCGTTQIKTFGLPTTDYPDKEESSAVVTFSIDTKELAYLLVRGGYAVGTDDARRALTGVLFDVSAECITITSTDGKRLAWIDYACNVETETAKQFIVPAAAISMLSRLKGDKVEFAFADKYINAKAGDVEFQSKLIDGNFPNYKAVIPSNLPEKVEINSDEFLRKLAIVSTLVATEPVELTFEGEKLKLSAVSSDGKIEDSMNINSSCAKSVVMKFNPAFLTSAVSACGDGTFNLRFYNEASPVKFEFASNANAVIMPIRSK